MAFHNKIYRVENSLEGGLGIGPHDYVVHTYDGNNNLTASTYYRGGSQDSGEQIAVVNYTYDGDGNLITIERVS